MILFKQNDELTLPENPVSLVAENCFINKEMEQMPLPVFEEVRDKLPAPVWNGHEDYIECYWKAWELAFNNLRKPQEGTGFVSNFIDTAFNDSLIMWDSAFILMFGKYAQRIFDFQGTLNNLYSHQHRDGYICREIDIKTGRDRFTRYDISSTGPDIMPWCHLTDEESFKTPNRIPALAKNDKNFKNSGNYWRGGVWAPTNYMVLKGLDKYGRYELAHEIAMDYLCAVVDVFKRTNTLFENYAPEYIDGKFSKGNPAKSDFVGWTGLAPISIMFEYILGIKPDAANNKILWDINLVEEHGIKKYPFGADGELTLICKKRDNENERPQIIFESNIPVKLEIVWGKENEKQIFITNT